MKSNGELQEYKEHKKELHTFQKQCIKHANWMSQTSETFSLCVVTQNENLAL